jgi:hypothetical protein
MIWFRQPGETEEAWGAFQSFRDQKSPRKMVRPGGPPTADVSRWAKDHCWFERAAEYDKHCDGVRLKEREALLAQDEREVVADHRRILADGREFIEREMSKLLTMSRGSDLPGTVKPGELVKLIDTVIKFDRLLRDQSTESVRHEVDLSALSPEDLKKLLDLRKKLE